MSENNNLQQGQQTGKIIDESQYKAPPVPKAPGPVLGKGGDPLFRKIKATKEQLVELLDETTTVQDWIQRETCNNVALTCLNNENLKEIYFEIKDGFGEYGPILLMGFKTPQGVEIPRLKLLDNNGEVLEVLSGPLAIDELNKRASAYREFNSTYETIEIAEAIESENIITEEIAEYSNNN